jgi:uncharacterized protein (DUF1800 family)
MGRHRRTLATLGVDGGYTQKDVTELARVLTGWTITRERDGGEGRQCSPNKITPRQL